MDVSKMLEEIKAEHSKVVETIKSLERLAKGHSKRKRGPGGPPFPPAGGGLQQPPPAAAAAATYVPQGPKQEPKPQPMESQKIGRKR
jgi:hypothetical protein